jgi:hypothetical protein
LNFDNGKINMKTYTNVGREEKNVSSIISKDGKTKTIV